MHSGERYFTHKGRSKRTIPVGVLYSLSGHYGGIGREMLNGIMLAIEEANADDALDFTLAPIIYDPGCQLDNYYRYCSDLLYRHGVKHIVGCYTSASRKLILPLVEGANALLWHTARYEGFESSDSVMYLGAVPNQHVLPMLDYVLRHCPPEVYHVGSNYIWSEEIDRITGDVLEAHDGALITSQFLALGETDVYPIIQDILERRPPVILITLVGISAYRFYQVWKEMAATHAFLREAAPTRLSLTLCEHEVALVGAEALEGCLVSAVYFHSIRNPQNRQFVARYRQRFGEHAMTTVDAEAAWMSGHFLAKGIQASGGEDPASVREAVYGIELTAPNGITHINRENNHASLTPRLARIGADGQFHLLWEAPSPVTPDPWLTWSDLSR
ncbi:transporter substrate-binding domain-containing protein [Martelella alba]|uniref:ABC transporter substrate-binding protein n=1 Tax=Martelella alba TaxID=2590451 RepID=A0ABY2SEK1_9HYPH|nr:transporter substrate-binding domain-containing protein [Martelella alba]TKI02922.1 ABC transporter substrate-binding protein [Martelella alba]